MQRRTRRSKVVEKEKIEMKLQKRFSVIVPVYNVKRYLRRCIDSILGQSFTDFEMILVDDGSTDGSGELCETYGKQHSFTNKPYKIVVIHQKNGGLSEARNTGIHAATGEYLLFIDSDDFWEDSGFLERVNSYLRKKPDFLLFSLKRCDEKETKIWNCYPRLKETLVNRLAYDKAQVYLMKEDAYLVSACCKAIRIDFLKEKRLYFEKGLLSEDIDWHIRLVLAAKTMVYSNERGYIYRVREKSITTAPTEKNRKDLYYIIAKWADYFEKEELKKKYKSFIGQKAKKQAISNRKEELREAVLVLLAYEYFILLGHYDGHKVPREVELEKYKWLVKYGKSKKTIICRLVYRIFRRKGAGKVFGYMVRKRQN